MDNAERRSEPRPAREVSEELHVALDELHADDPRTERALRLLWRDLVAYAVDNGYRLDRAYRTIRLLVRVILVFAALIVVIMLATAFVLIKVQNDQNDQTRRIQQSRFESCKDTNRRHAQAIVALSALESASAMAAPLELEGLLSAIGRPLDAAARMRLATFELTQPAGGSSTVIPLIDAVVPLRSCRQLIYGSGGTSASTTSSRGATGATGTSGATGRTGAS